MRHKNQYFKEPYHGINRKECVGGEKWSVRVCKEMKISPPFLAPPFLSHVTRAKARQPRPSGLRRFISGSSRFLTLLFSDATGIFRDRRQRSKESRYHPHGREDKMCDRPGQQQQQQQQTEATLCGEKQGQRGGW